MKLNGNSIHTSYTDLKKLCQGTTIRKKPYIISCISSEKLIGSIAVQTGEQEVYTVVREDYRK